MNSKSKKILKGAIGFLLAAAIFYFVIEKLSSGWGDIGDALGKANVWEIIAGTLIISCSLSLSAVVWGLIMRRCFHVRVSWRQAFIMINLAYASRYIPGKLWFVFGIAYFARKWNIGQGNAVVTAIVNQLLAIMAAILLGAIFLGNEGLKIFPWWAALLLIVGTIMAIQPAILHRMLSIFARSKKQMQIPRMPIATVIFGILIMALLWLGVGCGLVIGTKSYVSAVAWRDYAGITGGFVLSYVLGYVVLIAPSGLGVREGALIFLLPETMIPAQKALFSISSRIWMTLAELINIIVALIFLLKSKDTLPEKQDGGEQ